MKLAKKSVNLILLLLFIGLPQVGFSESNNLVAPVEDLGCPYCSWYSAAGMKYARTIWDMVIFDGKLYMGGGNSSNIGPAQNAGPVPVITYDPETQQFNNDFLLKEDQVDSLYVHNGALYIPGHDPRESWAFGNLYVKRKNEQWVKYRTIPGGIHTYALAWKNKTMFAGLGSNTRKCLASSEDNGVTWQGHVTDNGRIYAFLQVAGAIYGVGQFYPNAVKELIRPKASLLDLAPVFEYSKQDGFAVREDLTRPEIFFPDTDCETLQAMKIVRPVSYKNTAIYIGAEPNNDHQAIPFGVYKVSSLVRGNVVVKRIVLPSRGMPWDLFTQGGKIYLLSSSKGQAGYQNTVWISDDGDQWQPKFSFIAGASAISFAKDGNTYYFGLGSYFEKNRNMHRQLLPKETGHLLRVIDIAKRQLVRVEENKFD